MVSDTRSAESVTEVAAKAPAPEARLADPGSTSQLDHREHVRRVLKEIQARRKNAPVLDPRSDDEIIGYNDIGAFD